MMYTNVIGYQIPNLSLPKAKKTNLNRYGRMRLDYLEQNEPNLCDQMMLEGTLLPSCRKMGLDAQQISAALEEAYAPDEAGGDPELEAAAALVEGRYRGKLAAGRKDLVVAALARRGFAYPVIKEAIRRVEEDG